MSDVHVQNKIVIEYNHEYANNKGVLNGLYKREKYDVRDQRP